MLDISKTIFQIKIKIVIISILIFLLVFFSYALGYAYGQQSMADFCSWSKNIEISLESGLLK
jgi:hypothetical protein